ncbi:flagellar hook capping FlgD N-terminal domain-containing protein [Jannaschia rubra]|uniref:Basal-body rod modification protein FlgD n=1 Tax=Jannaschia rubra TaxID=282197 RepID=A0A0M6XRX3_9RHOB|nr:flagellar hook capping FlgD N-terminal domain-containing protein [Jannaschia rubra]CTQ33462.1 Basal-body rod modification protein FlgD [Jannaschia rubra]SFG02230.1 flagellar basal-body rod modification protein FlgD [Jannaschia rubra]
MDVTAPTLGSAATASIAAPASGTSPTSDFDTFLRLLTAQIRNQDPLEPADSTAYTAQLATFSNVEQSVKTNDLLSQMIQRLDSQQVSGAAGWIGMEVRHAGPVAHDGGSTVLHAKVNPVADRAELVIMGIDGKEVARHPIDPKAETLRWPASGQGGTVPAGQYRLHVDAWAGDRQLEPTTVDHYARVTEVVLANGGAEMILPGGVRLPAGDMQSIRRPAT